jgi:hypothetical protein
MSSGNMDPEAVSPNIYLKSNVNVMSSEFKSGIGIGIWSSADDHSVTRNSQEGVVGFLTLNFIMGTFKCDSMGFMVHEMSFAELISRVARKSNYTIFQGGWFSDVIAQFSRKSDRNA